MCARALRRLLRGLDGELALDVEGPKDFSFFVRIQP